MPVMIVQSNTGTFSGTPGTATLAATEAGNTVLIVVGSSSPIMSSTGFTDDSGSQVGSAKSYVLRKSNVGASETSWTLTSQATTISRWYAYEVAGLAIDAPVDVKFTSTTSTGTGTTASTGTLARSTTYDGLVVGLHASYITTTTTPTTFSGHTGGMVEVDEGSHDDGVSKAVDLSVSMLAVQALAAYTCTATASATLSGTNNANATMVVYSAEGAKRDANIAHFWGFKVGVAAAGLGTGAAGSRYIETVVGTPAVTADGLQLASSAAAESAASATISFQATPAVLSYVIRARFRFDGSLPSVDTELVATTGTNPLVLRYVSASQKLGYKLSTGTEVPSDATVAADTWYGVDLRMAYVSPDQTGVWQVDYGAGPVTQTAATFTGGPTAGTVRVGWTGAITVPGVTFAYVAVSTVAGHYPLGDYTPALLKVDPAGTVTISGTSTNFGVMTGNATVAAWDATNARNAVDDWPPTVGGSADGAVAVTAHATDYMEFPLETYVLSGTSSLHAARVVVPMWAASATTATVRVVGFDGTTATTLFAEADPTTDNTSTPGWVCKMWRPATGWDQTKLDAAAVRVGSNDATPDIGPHAVGMEILVKAGDTAPQFGSLATSTRDPVSGGILGVAVTPTLGYDATLHYEEGGTPTDVATPGGTTTVEVIDAPDAPAVNYVALYPPAEDISDA